MLFSPLRQRQEKCYPLTNNLTVSHASRRFFRSQPPFVFYTTINDESTETIVQLQRFVFTFAFATAAELHCTTNNTNTHSRTDIHT